MSGNLILFILVLFPLLGAFASYLCGRYSKQMRNYMQAAVTTVEFALVLFSAVSVFSSGSMSFELREFMSRGLYLEMDGFRAVYTCVAAFMWMMTSIFSVQYFEHYHNRNRYYFFMLFTLSATMGVLLSSDLFTTFCFFEIMSFTSYVWVAHDEKPAAMRAAQTYMAVAVIGGLVMLMGLLMLNSVTGTLRFSELAQAAASAAQAGTSHGYMIVTGILILFGFGAKAGMFPLHIWLPKAHPVAPAPASALLSGILTKTGVFGILVISCSIFRFDKTFGGLLLTLGVITMFAGALLAVFSVDLKRTLACSSMSQIGFILVGIAMQCLLGEENALAARGTVLHMVNHSMIKLILFMVAGTVYMNLHKLNLNDIRGFGRKKPFLKLAFLVGGLSIGGVPLFSGYVSKTLLHESIVEYIEELEELGESAFAFHAAEWIFLLTGGMTLAYMTKLFVAVFVEKGEFEDDKPYIRMPGRFAIGLPAVVLFALGVLPGVFMNPIADVSQAFMRSELPLHEVHYFSLENLKGAMISIAIAAFVYFVVIRCLLCKKENGKTVYLDRWPSWLDIENLIYRPLIERFLPFLFGTVFAFVSDTVPRVLWKAVLETGKHLAGLLDLVVDKSVAVLRKTLFRPVVIGNEKSEFRRNLEKKLRRRERNDNIIASSLSYGLLLICFGLLITIFYLISLLIW